MLGWCVVVIVGRSILTKPYLITFECILLLSKKSWVYDIGWVLVLYWIYW